MSKTLIITTPKNQAYDGRTFGVKFEAGRAVVGPHTPPNAFGWSMAQLQQKFKNEVTGYEVQVVGDEEEAETAAATITEKKKGRA